MLILNRFEIGFSKEMVCGVKYQILASKTKMLGKQLFLGCMCGRFGVLMGPRWLGMVDMLIPDRFEIGFS